MLLLNLNEDSGKNLFYGESAWHFIVKVRQYCWCITTHYRKHLKTKKQLNMRSLAIFQSFISPDDFSLGSLFPSKESRQRIPFTILFQSLVAQRKKLLLYTYLLYIGINTKKPFTLSNWTNDKNFEISAKLIWWVLINTNKPTTNYFTFKS